VEFTGEKTFPATPEAVGRSVAWVRETAAAAELPAARSLHLELAVEESVANVVRHAYAGRPGEFRIRLAGDLGIVHVEIEDAGIPFDPTGEKGSTAVRQEERRAGGHGLDLIRRVTSRLSYRRENGLNRLTFDLASEA
jgi:anti-sigma regulatory factor (Ser/Thr protein kinase)